MKTQRALLALTLWLTACVPVTTTVNPPPTDLVPTQGYPGPATETALPTAMPTTATPPIETPVPTPPFPGAQVISLENVGSLTQLSQSHKGNEIYDIAWSPDSRSVAFLKFDGLFVLDLATGQQRQVQDATTFDQRSEIAFSPEGELLAQSVVGEEIRLFNVQTGKLAQTFVDDGAESFAFSPEGRSMISTGSPVLKLWDVASGRLIREFESPEPIYKFREVAFAPSGEFVAASTTGGGIFVWNVNSGDIKFQTTISLFLARELVFSPDSQLLAVGDSSRSGLQLWSIDAEQMTLGVNTQTAVNGIAFTRDGSVIASAGGAPNVIEFWNTENEERIARIELATREFDLDFVEDISFSPDGRLFASAGGGGSGIVIWGVVLP
jgi:WD40 repeat protein